MKDNTKKTVIKSLIKARLCRVTIWVSAEDREEMRQRSKLYAGDNLSAWVRHAATNYEPAQSELAAVG